MLRAIGYLFLTLVFLALAGAGIDLYLKSLQSQENEYDPIIASVARNEGVDPFLIRALIWRESHFYPLTHGGADEHGLMQVRPDVGAMWAKANKIENYSSEDLYKPETNIRVGTWYLNRSLKRWSQTDDPVSFALAEYNAGHSNALKWVDPLAPQSHLAFIDRITFPGTRKYVEVIQEKRAEFSREFATDRWYKDDADVPSTTSLVPPTNADAPATNTP